MIKTLAHVCFFSRDLQRTSDFYCDTLGLRRKFDFLRDGQLGGFYLEVDARHFIEVFAAETGAEKPVGAKQIAHFCFEVESVDAVRSALLAKGVAVTEKKLGADQSWQCWCQDPDGIDLEFHEYTAASAQQTGQPCVMNW